MKKYKPWVRPGKINEDMLPVSEYSPWKKPGTVINEIKNAYSKYENYAIMLSYDELIPGECYDRVLVTNTDAETLMPYIQWGQKKYLATKRNHPTKDLLLKAKNLATSDQTLSLANIMRRYSEKLKDLKYFIKLSSNSGRTKLVAEELSRELSCMITADRIFFNGEIPEHRFFICTCYHGMEPLRDVWNENPKPLNESIRPGKNQ